MSETQKKSQIMGALLEAQKSLWGVTRNARNEFSKYDYTSAENIIGCTRRHLQKAGLVVGRKSIQCELVADESKDHTEIKVSSTFFLFHVASEEEITYEFQSIASVSKGNTTDKAIAGSLTQSLAYWLRDLFLLPRVDQNQMNSIKKSLESNPKIHAFNEEMRKTA